MNARALLGVTVSWRFRDAASGITVFVRTVTGVGTVLTDQSGKTLYTFRLDNGPGQLHGNNFRDQFDSQSFTWHAVTTGGGAVTSGQPSSLPSYSYQGGNSGY